MDFSHVVKNRREITSFLNKHIPDESLEEIIKVACLAPTGNNLPSREFVVVRDRNMLNKLSNATPFVKWLQEAQVAIVITGCPNISKYWIQDASISSGYLWLAAVNEGLGCAFGAILNTANEIESQQRESFVKEALSIPDDRRVVAILGLGYQKEKPNKKIVIPQSELVHFERFFKNTN